MKSDPDTLVTREFAEEVERDITREKDTKAQGMDGLKSDIKKKKKKLEGQIVITYLTNILNNILKTKQIPDNEAKIVILFKKGDPKRHQELWTYKPPVTQTLSN